MFRIFHNIRTTSIYVPYNPVDGTEVSHCIETRLRAGRPGFDS